MPENPAFGRVEGIVILLAVWLDVRSESARR
jgi:hypothetical protein